MFQKMLLSIQIHRLVKEYEKQMIAMLKQAAGNPTIAAMLRKDYYVSKVMIKRRNK